MYTYIHIHMYTCVFVFHLYMCSPPTQNSLDPS